MGGRLKIGSLGGIPIYISSTWIWIALLYTYFFYLRFTQQGVFISSSTAIALAVLATLLFFGSVFVHEVAHAITARTLGLSVAGITLEFWGGRTETEAERRGPWAEFLVSAVGPGSTLVLAGLFWLASRSLADGQAIGDLLRWLGGVNLLLAGVNAIPGFPLDGGRMFLATVWAITGDREKALRAAGTAGLVLGAGLGVFGVTQLSNGGGFGIWFLFLAWILIGTSRSLRARVQVRRILSVGRVSDAMAPAPGQVPAEMTLSQALDLFLRDNPQEVFPVVEDGRVVGAVSLESAEAAPAAPFQSVREGMISLAESGAISPDERLDRAVDLIRGRRVLVFRGGDLLGSISNADIGRWFERRSGAAPKAGDSWTPPRPDI